MKIRVRTDSLGKSRILFIGISCLYAVSLFCAYEIYLSQVWGYYGFTFSPPSVFDMAFVALAVLACASVVPMDVRRPSSLIIVALYLTVVIPTFVVTSCFKEGAVETYVLELLALILSFVVVCLANRRRGLLPSRNQVSPSNHLLILLVISWAVVGGFLFYKYNSIMRFVGIGEMYYQRAASASDGAVTAYAKSYFYGVIVPGLIALGLVRSRVVLVLMGIAGCLLMYAITAQKILLLMPVLMIALFNMVNKGGLFVTSSFFVVFLATSLVSLSLLAYALGIFESLVAVLLFRTLGLPGLAFSQYVDVFSLSGHTWWSHVKGFASVVPTPSAYAGDPSWPNLGYMIGDRVYGNSGVNANANFFVWDGVAAAGALGVVLVGFACAGFLRAFDQLGSRLDSRFVLLISVPLSLLLTNGSIFTVLLSFGGLFWLLVFRLHYSSIKTRY